MSDLMLKAKATCEIHLRNARLIATCQVSRGKCNLEEVWLLDDITKKYIHLN